MMHHFRWFQRGLKLPRYFTCWNELLEGLRKDGKLHLPNLRLADSLAVFTDYSNKKTARSLYDTYAFLFTDFGMIRPFSEKIAQIRKTRGLRANFEFSYKRLADGRAANAMHEFMREVDALPGLLLVLAVPRNVQSLFGATRKEALDHQVAAGFASTPKVVAETTFRVVHLLAYFLALLGREGQKLLWMTDNDDIAANSRVANQLRTMYGNALNGLCPGRFEIVGFATQFGPESEPTGVDFDAMLSIPDLFAGSVASALTQLDRGPTIKMKEGTDSVVRVLCHQGVFLKKMILRADAIDRQGVDVSHVQWRWTGADPYAVSWVRVP